MRKVCKLNLALSLGVVIWGLVTVIHAADLHFREDCTQGFTAGSGQAADGCDNCGDEDGKHFRWSWDKKHPSNTQWSGVLICDGATSTHFFFFPARDEIEPVEAVVRGLTYGQDIGQGCDCEEGTEGWGYQWTVYLHNFRDIEVLEGPYETELRKKLASSVLIVGTGFSKTYSASGSTTQTTGFTIGEQVATDFLSVFQQTTNCAYSTSETETDTFTDSVTFNAANEPETVGKRIAPFIEQVHSTMRVACREWSVNGLVSESEGWVTVVPAAGSITYRIADTEMALQALQDESKWQQCIIQQFQEN
jgi:hypothetical protein